MVSCVSVCVSVCVSGGVGGYRNRLLLVPVLLNAHSKSAFLSADPKACSLKRWSAAAFPPNERAQREQN